MYIDIFSELCVTLFQSTYKIIYLTSNTIKNNIHSALLIRFPIILAIQKAISNILKMLIPVNSPRLPPEV